MSGYIGAILGLVEFGPHQNVSDSIYILCINPVNQKHNKHYGLFQLRDIFDRSKF